MDYRQAAIDALNNCSPVTGSGVSCNFYKLDEYVGVKFYKSKSDCDKTYIMQAMAHAVDLGPAVIGEKFVVNLEYGRVFYGYLTEIVVIHNSIMGGYDEPQLEVYSHTCAACNYFSDDLSIYVSDMHVHNFGWNQRGFKIIDFDHCYVKQVGDDWGSYDSAAELIEHVSGILSAY